MARAIRGSNFSDKIRSVFRSFKLLSFLGFFALAIGATLYMTTQQQDIRQNASYRSFFPPTYRTPTPRYPTPTSIRYPTPTSASYGQGGYNTYNQGSYYGQGSYSNYSQASYAPSYSCSANQYIAGTYCTSSISCYDIYCNSSGTGTIDRGYNSTVCGFCATYRCTANSFIAGTYSDGSRKYDVYCNSSGTATVKRYY